MRYVVGSGPAGVAAATALLDRGFPVTMLDAGDDLHPDITAVVKRLAKRKPDAWDPEDLAVITRQDHGSGTPVKRIYGSLHPYHENETQHGVSCTSSRAKGGLSTVWGAAVLPYLQKDMPRWPITAGDLAPHYDAVSRLFSVTGEEDDDLSERFRFPSVRPHEHSRHAKAMLARARKHRHAFAKSGLSIGAARLAVDSKRCVRCGMCMYGCPYDLIYSSTQTLRDLLKREGFSYLPGNIVERVEERGDRVVINARDAAGKQRLFDAERVFLAAGALQTTRILMESLGIRKTEMKDSQYIVLPALALDHGGDVAKERLHTLAQLFLELDDPRVSPHTIHAQIYTYNPLFRDALSARLRSLKHLVPWRHLLPRFVIIQMFLHSEESHRISVERQKEGFVLRVVESPKTRRVAKAAMRAIARRWKMTGLIPLLPFAEMALPGKSFHFGGSFPMRRSVKRGVAASDALGRPAGLKRVHAVDASVFPEIAATTITFTAMANAHRIASEAP